MATGKSLVKHDMDIQHVDFLDGGLRKGHEITQGSNLIANVRKIFWSIWGFPKMVVPNNYWFSY